MPSPDAMNLLRTPLAAAVLAALAVLLSACGTKPSSPDNEPTLKALAGRTVDVPVGGQPMKSSESQAIAAYTALLAAGPTPKQRAEALRRLGDLEMDRSDRVAAAASGPEATQEYKAAITRYQDYLRAYPQDPGNDKVLYQLARAHEQAGDLESAQKVLDRLVAQYPQTRYRDEAEFRRGEQLFTARQYPAAETAYATVLAGAKDNPYRERALYMQGWAQFKQGRLDQALASFLGVLDGRLAGKPDDVPLEKLPDLTRADRELVEDSFRVTSLALQNLQGAESIPALIQSDARRSYEVRLYQQLAALYLKQERPKDAADTYLAFARLHPQHGQAPVLQARVIEIYEKAGFAQQALAEKKAFVGLYGPGSAFEKANPVAWKQAQPLVKTHLAALAAHYHALAQAKPAPVTAANRGPTDAELAAQHTAAVTEAVQWYRALLAAFPDDAEAARNRFLLAELLFENKRFAEAATEYERVAYAAAPAPAAAASAPAAAPAGNADAGYAGLLAHAEQAKLAGDEQRTTLQRETVASGLRFAKRYPADSRTPAVLANAADTLLRLGDAPAAADAARQLLALQPAAPDAQRRVAFTVLGQTAFDAKDYAASEKAYRDSLALTAANAAERSGLAERLAAAIYQQGDQARAAGRSAEAANHFERVAEAAPSSSVRVNAQYDAAAARLSQKDWAGAVRLLEDFRQRYPNHALQKDLPPKLALAYTELGRWAEAAAETERVAAATPDAELARAARWQAAELYEKANATPQAAAAWERYVRQYPAPLDAAIEARAHLVKLNAGNPTRALAWQQEILQADRAGGSARTPRTRALAAQAALALAEPVAARYRQVALVEPLQAALKLKKSRFDEALKAYALATEDGVADTVTAATYQTAMLYQDFGQAMLSSERPKKLSKTEREQYDVLLEEQAFPFEEKAAELHTLNVQRSTQGLYDDSVKRSFAALRTLRPARYGKAERSNDDLSALPPQAAEAARQREAGQLAEALASGDAALTAKPDSATLHEQRGLTLRLMGRFADARAAYEKALALDANHANAALNLGVLLDLYLDDAAGALAQYQRYLALTPAGDPAVAKWVTELKNRKPAPGAAKKEAT